MQPINDNHELIRRGLDLLRLGLRPFVQREMSEVYGDSWEEEGRNALGTPSYAKLTWDAHALLKLIDRRWNDVFRKKLEKRNRAWVHEALAVRNDFAHQNSSFSDDDALRGLDTFQRLLEAVSAPERGEVALLKMAVNAKQAINLESHVTEKPSRRIIDLRRVGVNKNASTKSPPVLKTSVEIQAMFEEFLSHYDRTYHREIWQKQSQMFKKFWIDKILNPNVELTTADTDPIIIMLDIQARGHKKTDESVALVGLRPPNPKWDRLFGDLKEKKDIQQTVSQIFAEPDDISLVGLIDCLERQNEKYRNGLTGEYASALNALLFINEPTRFVCVTSLGRRFKMIRVLALGDPDDFKSYGQQVVRSNRMIIDGLKQKYGIPTEVSTREISNFLHSPDGRALWDHQGEGSRNDVVKLVPT